MPDFLSKSTEEELRRMMAKMRSLNVSSERGGHVRPSTPFTDLVQFELRANETIPGGNLAPYVSTSKIIKFDDDSETYTPVETSEPEYKLHWSLAPKKTDGTYWDVILLRSLQRVWCAQQFGRWEIVWPYDFSVYCKLSAGLQGMENYVAAAVWDRINGTWTNTGKSIQVYAPPWWDINTADQYEDALPSGAWVRASYHAASKLWFITDRPREILAIAQLQAELKPNDQANARLYTYNYSWSLSAKSVTVKATPVLKTKIAQNTNIQIIWKPEWNIWILANAPSSSALKWGSLTSDLSAGVSATVRWEGETEDATVWDWRIPYGHKIHSGRRVLGIEGRADELDSQGNKKLLAVTWPLYEADSVIDVGACPNTEFEKDLTKKHVEFGIPTRKSDPAEAQWESYHVGAVCPGDEL